MAKTRKTVLKVLFEGTDISDEINSGVTSFSYTDNLDKADEISLSISDIDKKWINSWAPLKGESITPSIRVIEEEGETSLQCGEFSIDKRNFSGPPDALKIGALSIEVTSNFNRVKKNRAIENTTLKAVCEKVAEENDLTLVFLSDEEEDINRVEQIEETDSSFLYQLAKEYAKSLKVLDKKLVIFDEQEYESKDAIKTIKKQEIKSYSFGDEEFDTWDAFEINYFDQDLKETLTASGELDFREGYKNKTSRVLKLNDSYAVSGSKEEKEKQLESIGWAKLREKNKAEVQGNISLMGDVDLVAGVVITTSGFGIYDYKYLITQAVHSMSNGYETKIKIRRVLDF